MQWLTEHTPSRAAQVQHSYQNGTDILHVQGDHWTANSNLLCSENETRSRVYDTVYNDIDQPTKALLIECLMRESRLQLCSKV